MFAQHSLLVPVARPVQRVRFGQGEPQRALPVAAYPGLADELTALPHRPEPLVVEVVRQPIANDVVQRRTRRRNITIGQRPNDDLKAVAPNVAWDDSAVDLAEIVEFQVRLTQSAPRPALDADELTRLGVPVLQAAASKSLTRDLPAAAHRVDCLQAADPTLHQPVQREVARSARREVRQFLHPKIIGQSLQFHSDPTTPVNCCTIR